ncbi:MAG: DNA polymerase III subunit epsilon [Alphaproteobacteria bacterium BRH_c36]|nr:MAG: DNA polymerase III subunit epsilon [Alphaproteobacteria bacterium BRH_c36]
MRREIVLDTETTGLSADGGDRLVEIGCVELVNRMPTGREFHVYINPERAVPVEAANVHGLTTEFLFDKPVFAKVARPFLDFIKADTLVIHNADFDVGFLNMELRKLSAPLISGNRVVDTLAIARRKHPGGPNTLDALCKRYGIDNSRRTKHGALLDSLLLAEVYIELLDERQARMELAASGKTGLLAKSNAGAPARVRPNPLPPRLSEAEAKAHMAFLETLGEAAIWLRYR